MPPEIISVTLSDSEVVEACATGTRTYEGNALRWGRELALANPDAFIPAVGFASYLARQTRITFSGPLPYCGPGRGRPGDHQPETFAVWVKGDQYTISLHRIQGATYRLPVFRLERPELVADFTIGAKLGGGRPGVPTRVDFMGAVTRQGLLDAAAAVPTTPATRPGLNACKHIPVDVFSPTVLQTLLRDADKS